MGNDKHAAKTLIVQPGMDRLIKMGSHPIYLGGAITDLVRVVKDYEISPSTGERAIDRGREDPATSTGLQIGCRSYVNAHVLKGLLVPIGSKYLFDFSQ